MKGQELLVWQSNKPVEKYKMTQPDYTPSKSSTLNDDFYTRPFQARTTKTKAPLVERQLAFKFLGTLIHLF